MSQERLHELIGQHLREASVDSSLKPQGLDLFWVLVKGFGLIYFKLPE